MGEVYQARDTLLDRSVALKILPADVATDAERMRRFVSEAKAASALNHPHVATIYEIGEADNVRFIAMEYVEGQTLASRINGHPLAINEVVEIGSQIADALDEAHSKGITHRDIKPANVMLTPRGQVKVLDFGLAKITRPESIDSNISTLAKTQSGVVMGTVPYMSPEQALGRDVDHRSDIFSLGVVLYEMATGRLPFAGTNTVESLDRLLHAQPEAIGQLNTDAPAELERIVHKCLEKEREQRYETSKDLLIDLKDLQRKLEFAAENQRRDNTEPLPREALGAQASRLPLASASDANSVVRESSEDEAMPSPPGRAAVPALAAGGTPALPGLRAFVGQHKIIIAMAAVILIAVATFLYLNRKPALTDNDTILLADFVNTTGDEVFDGTLKQALAVQLEQSPFLNIFSEERVRESLRLMSRAPDERVTREVAREICQRQGLKAMLLGSIAKLDRNYAITLEAINGQNGETIARQQAEAEGKDQVLKTLGSAAMKLREKLGESLASIKKFDVPIEQATTSSLEALKAYSLGQVQYNVSIDRATKAISLYQRAIELDPSFASAYAALARVCRNSGLCDAAKYAEMAFERRKGVSEREKFYIASIYYWVTWQSHKTIEVAELFKQTYPRDWFAHNLLSINYRDIGQHEKALETAREASRLNPNNLSTLVTLARALRLLERFEEAKPVLAQGLALNPDDLVIRRELYLLALAQGDNEGLKQQFDWARSNQQEPERQWELLTWQISLAQFAGQLSKARELARRAASLPRGNSRSNAEPLELTEAVAALTGDCSRISAAKTLADARPLGRSIIYALALASCGKLEQAQAIANELARSREKDVVVNGVSRPLILAAVELHRDHPAEAIRLLQPVLQYEGGLGTFRPPYLRGQAYLQQRAGIEAMAEFQKIITHRGWAPESYLYPLAHLGLARAAALAGDVAKSRQAYQNFFALWKDADSDLPILVQAKKEQEELR